MSEAPQPAPRDESIRNEVVDPARSFLVQAPAGAGKTMLLVRRYLRLLSRVRQPEQIVAVTFTRKAAAEMRERVLKQLGPEADDRFSALAQARDRELGWNLRDTPARLRIMTFDSLALALAGRMPWRARVAPAPRPVADADALYRAAAQRALSSATPAARELLRLGRAQTQRLVPLLADLLGTRDQWSGMVETFRRDPDLRGTLENELQRRRNALLETARGLIHAAGNATLLPDLARQAAQWARAHDRDPALHACLDLHQLPAAAEADWELWLGVATLLLTQDGKPRRGRTLGLTADETASISPSPELVAVFNEIRKAPGPALAELDWQAIPALLDLLPQALAALRQVFTERGGCDFIAVAEAAVAALGGDDAPSDLAFALDGGLHHLLVDEFQDTSPAQLALLRALTREWQPAEDGRTLFLVGDAMQSIYGFRAADVRQFTRLVREQRLGHVQLTVRAIGANFRASRQLVTWCSQTFRQVAPPDGGFVEAEPTRDDHSTVRELLALPDADPRTEARAIAALVATLRAERGNATIAILAANRRHLNALLPALANAAIPLAAVELLRLESSPVVQDLLALTRALLDPADRVAGLALLRAPWCGLRLDDLEALCQGDRATPVLELLRTRSAALSPDGRRRAETLLTVLQPALSQAGRTPPRALVEWCWQRLGADAWLAPGQRTHAAAFFALLDELQSGGDLVDLDRLREEAARLFLPPAGEGANPVQLMTIHQAKGLEFDTVILPSLHRRGGRNKGDLLLWNEDETRGVLLANGLAGELRGLLRRARTARERAERLRLMYVACTRAARRLYLFAHVAPGKRPHVDSSLAPLWPALAAHFPAPPTAVAAAPPPPDAMPPPLRRVTASWRPPAPAPGLRWQPPAATTRSASQPAYADASLRGVGLAVHAILLRMAASSERQYEPARLAALLRSFGAHDSAAFQAAETALSRIAASPRGQWILASHSEARNELALSGVVGNETRFGILDRTFLDDSGTRWVIDYKTGSSPSPQRRDEHRRQVETYAALLAAQHGDPLRCGLYYLLRDEWVEWTPDLTTSP